MLDGSYLKFYYIHSFTLKLYTTASLPFYFKAVYHSLSLSSYCTLTVLTPPPSDPSSSLQLPVSHRRRVQSSRTSEPKRRPYLVRKSCASPRRSAAARTMARARLQHGAVRVSPAGGRERDCPAEHRPLPAPAEVTTPRPRATTPAARFPGLPALAYATTMTVPTAVFLVPSDTCLVDLVYAYSDFIFDFVNVHCPFFFGGRCISNFFCVSMYCTGIINTW